MPGKTIVEQIDTDGEISLGCDQSLSTREIFDALKQYFPHIEHSRDGLITGRYQGHSYSIRIKNITYLGNPHPIFKKRIQIPNDLHQFYDISLQHNMTPLLLGIYTCGDLTLFCDFNIEDFIFKKANNSSAHVYTSDMSSAVTDGIFQKTDFMQNRITVFRPDCIPAFLDDKFGIDASIREGSYFSAPVSTSAENSRTPSSMRMTQEIKDIIMNFFLHIPKRWNGIDCYAEMIRENYRNMYQPEWAGFYLEYLFENYLAQNDLQHLIRYEQDKTKGGIDLDLFFPSLSDYGDLKAHSEHSSGIQGNDQRTIFQILSQPGLDHHIYYIVCEHATYKDSEYNYEVTKFWNRARHKDDLMSYHKRMKHHVELKKAYILDINNSNKQYLSMFKQGVNSNGKLREPKIMIDHDMLPKFSIASLEL